MQTISNCSACSFRNCLQDGSVPISGVGNRAAKIVVISLRSTIEAHIVEKPLGTRNSILLKKIAEAAGLTDRDYYLTNAVKCAGPVKPAKEFNANAKTCIDLHLKAELALINPKYIICLGVGVAKYVCGDNLPTIGLTYLRDNKTIVVTYSMEELYRHGAAYFNHAVETFKKAKNA